MKRNDMLMFMMCLAVFGTASGRAVGSDAGAGSGAGAAPVDAAVNLDLGAMVQPVPAGARFADPEWHIWCGAPTRTADGKCHLYFSRWPVAKGFAPGWALWSEIAYAVADRPEGPYKFVNVALPARGRAFWDGTTTHNPNVLQQDGKFYLFYMGNTGDGQSYPMHRNNQRIGVAVAEKPEGPWKRFDRPIVDVSPDKAAFDSLCVTNPAAAVRPDGGILLIYKAVEYVEGKVTGGRVRYGAALADKPEGPYTKAPGRIFESDAADDGKTWMLAEDPFIWFSRRYGNRYYAVARDVVGRFTGAAGGLALFESADGLKWKPAAHPKVLGSRFAWADGKPSAKQVERPALLIGQDGVPAALFGATDGYQKTGSINVRIPLKAAAARAPAAGADKGGPGAGPAAPRRVWRIMAVGDSITEGGKTFATYRVPLRDKLEAAGYPVVFVGSRESSSVKGPLAHEGYGGRNAEFLATAAPKSFREHPADVVLIHAGHNHFVEEKPVAGIVKATESMIQAFRDANPKVIVLLAQVIPSGKLPKYSYIPELNRELAALAARLDKPEQRVVLVNQAEGFDAEKDTMADKVHPNERGAEKMAGKWFDGLSTVLPKPKDH